MPRRSLSSLTRLGIDRVNLAGHSLGCLFAARFARHLAPPALPRSALLSPCARLQRKLRAPRSRPPSRRASTTSRISCSAAFAAKRARPGWCTGRRPSPLFLAGRPARDGRRSRMARLRPSRPRPRQRERCWLMPLPSTVPGRRGRRRRGCRPAPPANAQFGLRRPAQPGGPLAIIPDAGHALPQEAPSRVAQLLMEEAYV